jgi:hypothetical protein
MYAMYRQELACSESMFIRTKLPIPGAHRLTVVCTCNMQQRGYSDIGQDTPRQSLGDRMNA